MSRIDELLAAMTAEEKIGQLSMVSADLTPAGPQLGTVAESEIAAGRAGSVLMLWGAERVREAQRAAMEGSRLGIPLLVCLDVLHGHRTVFPIPLAEAAAFDVRLWEATAREAAAEVAADGVALTFAPMLDVSRDPRWGRIAESGGEDPWINALMADAKVRGFQRGGERFADDAVAATAKHLAAYGASIGGLDYAAVDLSERTLHETYLPPFRAAVASGVAAIMPAFVSLAGVPMTSNRRLLRDVLRRQWGFDGVVISDYQAVAELIVQGVAGDMAEAAALALAAGVDIDMVDGAYAKGLPAAIARGLVEPVWIDQAVRRVLRLKERLGLFDRPLRLASVAPVPLDAEGVRRSLAREAACRSIVLLKNADEILPLAGSVHRIALVGPFADASAQMLGPWALAGRPQETVSILAGLRRALPECEIECMPGADIDGTTLPDATAVRRLCSHADVILLCLGEAADMAGEATSRARPGLPECQQALAEVVLGTGKPVVVILTSGRPLIATSVIERAQAVLATWFLGSEAGTAIADVLTGRCNPSGRLPVTWPRAVGQIPIFFAAWPTGRPADPHNRYTSKYIDLSVEPLFAFGHGLSYTGFSYANLQLNAAELSAGDRLVAEVEVRNDGPREGEATVFLFTHDRVARIARPLLELKAMGKARLAPGEKTRVALSLPIADLAYLDERLERVLEPGAFDIYVGPSAARSTLLHTTLQVR